jgi:bifunctional UDP-N-acetylglucosamine pyrophosphorylase/glucosamine-1-phosphate N-acetyltransferase
MRLSNRTRPAGPSTAIDDRLTPTYYVHTHGALSIVDDLLSSCRTVFDVKGAVALVLASAEASGLLRGEQGVVEPGAVVESPVIVQAGARIAAGARVIGPVLVCAGAVIAGGALVRDHTWPRCVRCRCLLERLHRPHPRRDPPHRR